MRRHGYGTCRVRLKVLEWHSDRCVWQSSSRPSILRVRAFCATSLTSRYRWSNVFALLPSPSSVVIYVIRLVLLELLQSHPISFEFINIVYRFLFRSLLIVNYLLFRRSKTLRASVWTIIQRSNQWIRSICFEFYKICVWKPNIFDFVFIIHFEMFEVTEKMSLLAHSVS